MNRSLAAVGALAGALLIMPLAQSPASASPASGLKDLGSTAPSGQIDLVQQGGGRGGGGGLSGGGGRGGGGGLAGGGGRGGGALSGGGRGPSLGGPSRGGRAFTGRGGGREFSGRLRGGDRRFTGRDFDRPRVGRDFRRHAGKNGDWRRGKHRHRHRHGRDFFFYGAPYLAYGVYAGDCYWLYQRAVATSSPYWWSRYNACVGYDYY